MSHGRSPRGRSGRPSDRRSPGAELGQGATSRRGHPPGRVADRDPSGRSGAVGGPRTHAAGRSQSQGGSGKSDPRGGVGADPLHPFLLRAPRATEPADPAPRSSDNRRAPSDERVRFPPHRTGRRRRESLDDHRTRGGHSHLPRSGEAAHRSRRDLPHRRPRRVHRSARSIGEWQDDAASRARGPGATPPRAHRHRRRGRLRCRAEGPPAAPPPPGGRGLPG